MRAGDRDLATADDLFAVLDDQGTGTALTITLVRGSDEHTVTVTWPATPTA